MAATAGSAWAQIPVITGQEYTYKTVDGLEIGADVHVASGPGPHPVVMNIHGGALIFGSRHFIQPMFRALLNDAGFTVVSIDYRLAPETKMPGIVNDVEDAYAWLLTEGPRLFNIDPERVVVAGDSAGGYLTQTMGFRLRPRPRALLSFWGYGEITGDWYAVPSAFHNKKFEPISREQAMAGVGSTLLTNASWEKRVVFYHYCRQQGRWLDEVTGHNPRTEDAWFTPYSPIRNVDEDYPPTIFIHGTADTDVPYAQSKMMADQLARANVEHELFTVPGADHMLFGSDGSVIRRSIRHAVDFARAHVS